MIPAKRYILSILGALLLSGIVCAQEHVTGIVLNADSLPMAGVSVAVEGTTLSTITDEDGHFELLTDKTAVLVISYVGYGQMVITAADLSNTPATLLVLKPEPLSSRKKDRRTLVDYSSTSHRWAVWGAGGMSSPLEAFTTPGKFGSYSYAGGGIGTGYRLRHRHLLLTTGLEALSINYKMEQTYSQIGASGDGSIGFDMRHVVLLVPVMMGMEYPWWYWQAGAKLGFMDYCYAFNHHQDIRNQQTNFGFLCSPAVEAGVNINCTETLNCKIGLSAESLMNFPQKSSDTGWWLQFLFALKCTLSIGH